MPVVVAIFFADLATIPLLVALYRGERVRYRRNRRLTISDVTVTSPPERSAG